MQIFMDSIFRLSRKKKVALQIILDLFFLTVSFFCAMLVQLESLSFLQQLPIWGMFFLSALITLLIFWVLGLYQVIVRFLTGKVLLIIGKGALVAGVSLYFVAHFFYADLPNSVPFIFSILAFVSVGGLRFAARKCFRAHIYRKKSPVIIYGAGDAGLQLLNALFHDSEFIPVAIVDDDAHTQGMMVGGFRIYSPEEIPRLAQTTGAEVILLAIPATSLAHRRQIVSSLKDLGLAIKTIPSLSEIISEKTKISEVRTVSAEDLLGRDPVNPDAELLSKDITGRVVMVSGGGGSIGSELCRQILAQGPSVLIIYEVSEFALYTIEAELTENAALLQLQTRIVPLLGSVQHTRRLEAAIKTFKVQTIYHAAAYKHVPIVEENVIEGIRNNVFGTLAFSLSARKFGVEKFILISTDKAVRPTNVMGASKRIAELICQAQGQEAGGTTFSMVRFGNVLGSSGSVIPRFRAQIEAGGPVTVTDENITRYFMTIPEAAQLVIQAGAMGRGGDVFVLNMGEAVKIIDLAFNMVKLHGLTPYILDGSNQMLPDEGHIPVRITGLRKGEKLYEELLIGNNPETTKHPRIMTASEVSLPYDILIAVLDRLRKACTDFDLPAIDAILHELPLDYAPLDEGTSDLLWNKVHDIEGRHCVSVTAGSGA